MSFSPLASASFVIQIHAFGAIIALFLGLAILLLRKGTRLHFWAGRIWVLIMLITSLSSFFISQSPIIGPFGVIHLLSVVTLIGLYRAVSAARRRDFKAHGRAMMALYFQALILAGLFTFMPGRIMNRVVFRSAEISEIVVLLFSLLGFAILLALAWRKSWALTR